jgi:hypothetical protein
VCLGCVLLIVASAGLEILGLGLVALELWRVQRRKLGTPRWVLRVRALWQRLWRRGRTVDVKATLHGSIDVEGALRLRVKRGPGDTLESRVAALEANLDELDRETQESFKTVDARLGNTERAVDESRQALQQLRIDQEEAEREELRRSIPWQWLGTGLFAIGALLGMWANLAC